MHDLDGYSGYGHYHKPGESENDFTLYELDNVELTTIGVDVGSSTFQVMFGRVRLCRDAKRLSARYEVVEREVLWRSEVGLTPYRARRIDADAVGVFVAASHAAAGIDPQTVDSGAVILTGEALRQQNARALGDAIAAGSGRFVCVSAGHHLESMLAAHGSGATEYSGRTGESLFHVDVGGGTTKLSLIEGGKVLATAAVMVGGRQVAWDANRRIVSTTAGAATIARSIGMTLERGAYFSPSEEEQFVRAQAEVIFAIVAHGPHPLGSKLRLTKVLPKTFEPDALSFSGGVSEYVYGRETEEFGDLGRSLGEALRSELKSGATELPLAELPEGIRATVVGAAQSTVQVSGNTVTVSDPPILPVRNIPVVHPEFPLSTEMPNSTDLEAAVRHSLTNYGLKSDDAVALAFTWAGDPEYGRMASFARGLERAINVPSSAPVVILIDADIARSLGGLLLNEFELKRPLICLDGLDLSPLDYVDVGRVLGPSQALPVVIKSLLFGQARE